MNSKISIAIKTLPSKAGVYQFFDKENNILYIGKAKNLYKRVSSYFNKIHDSARIRILVKKIYDIKHIVVDNEMDALLLENNLIKKLHPKYNIRLKDDKTYPYLCIKNERFPRVFITRKKIKDNSEYFGPYSNVKQIKLLLELIKDVYKIRTCNYDLSKENIEKGKFKICLEYHIKNCLGACEGYEEEENYKETIYNVRNMVKGNFKPSLSFLKNKMLKYSDELKFEQAHEMKEKLELLQNYQVKSTVVNPSIDNIDVFSIISDENYAYINYLNIISGAVVNSYNKEIKKCLDETDKEILQLAILEIRDLFKSKNKIIYLPFQIDYEIFDAKVYVPKIGDKKSIIDLSIKNAKYFRIDSLKQIKILDPERHTNRLMSQMKKDLNLLEEPRHIECFDNSNIQGTNPTASCVVFKNGKPSKKDYRNFNIKTVEGANDFASMEEVVYRRYSRLLEEEKPLPQLILIDGGKGQLSSAVKSLKELNLENKISIIGIAKKLEELYFPNDSIPLHLDKKSDTLKILQQLRDEAHRFALTHHRKKRTNKLFDSKLLDIPSIGNITAQKLLKKFKSIERIKSLNLQELELALDKKRAEIVYKYLKK